MTTPMIQENFASLTNLNAALSAIFFDNQTAFVGESLITQLYNVLDSDQAVERLTGIGGFNTVPEYKGVLEYASHEVLYPTTFTHKPFALGFAVDHVEMQDNEWLSISQRMNQFAMAFDYRQHTDGADTFNNAFSSSYLGGDSKALCATDHPRSPTDATTQGNKGTSALTPASLKATRVLMRKFTDSQGKRIPMNPDTILVPVDLEDTANVIVNSINEPGGANNDDNVNKRRYRVVVGEYLTDANNWFLIDSRRAKMSLLWWTREATSFVANPQNEFDLVYRWRGFMRYSLGWTNWNWIYGHEVA